MLDLPAKTIKTIKRYLLKQQQEVEKNLKEVEEDDPATDGILAESSEPGTDSYIADMHTRTLALKNHLSHAGLSAKAALQKIANGTYGKCEKCGKQIEVGRLLAMPTATLCVSCSNKKLSK